jgi:hypothetical protein
VIWPVLKSLQETWSGEGPAEDREDAFRGAVGALATGQSSTADTDRGSTDIDT